MIYNRISEHRQGGRDRLELSVIMNEITIDGKPMLDKDAIIKLGQMKKQSKANKKLYKKANPELAKKEQKYIDLINEYLPKGAEKEDIIVAISELKINKNIKNMGILMKNLKNKFEIVDGNMVKSVLLERENQ